MVAGALPHDGKPESIAYRVIIVAAVGPAITIPICLLRFYTKRSILRLVTIDDYLIIPATLLAFGFSILIFYQTTNGLGKHVWAVPADRFSRLMKIGVIAGPLFYNLSTLFTKVSLCAFYLRLSPSKSFTYAVYAVALVSILHNLIAALGIVINCNPIAKYWDYSITTGSCVNLNAFFLSVACINAATDLALLFLPIRIIWGLHLPMRRKISVAILLLTGSFVCVVSLIRVSMVVEGMNTTTMDATWGMVANFIWILIEMWLGIICACLPSLYSLLRKLFPLIHGRTRKPTLAAVRDPNSDRLEQMEHAESGYYSGQISQFSMRTVDQPVQPHMSPTVRPEPSDKSLISTVRVGEV
ncbi:hypothetical protein BCR34DRAFT_368527 [Clohesyomyces aquaticus]|uniref:Rhodopsin domain-containing protein n=1 Tax=Clohesyomyces aquaticus TaxID=1231657 RepID=A0A1Y1ZHE4_9PLEO|nr:hypothetical protein BCR34DRAFT_368527 [Clohesyomyces aquaticus]